MSISVLLNTRHMQLNKGIELPFSIFFPDDPWSVFLLNWNPFGWPSTIIFDQICVYIFSHQLFSDMSFPIGFLFNLFFMLLFIRTVSLWSNFLLTLIFAHINGFKSTTIICISTFSLFSVNLHEHVSKADLCRFHNSGLSLVQPNLLRFHQ